MPNHRGKFVWYELMTSDTKAAEAFYKEVIGWGAQDSGMPGVSYTILHAGSQPIGGLMAMPEQARKAGARPGWSGYVAVEDVDAAAAQVGKAGGKVHHGPDDIPTIGRFAVVGDPQGASFVLFKPSGEPDHPAPEPAHGTPGHVGWHQLQTTDQHAAFDFYSSLFGWTKGDRIDMGAMGIYQLFARGGVPIGGMMTKPPTTPAPSWLYFFNVADIDAAVARMRAAGGTVASGPNEVPGGSWVAQGADPQGATFAIVGPKS